MAGPREPTGPTQPIIKRLFAHSGNRCAYPRCQVALIQGETVAGEICHIRAAKPGGPRYDPKQTPEQRHDYDNLILLCPTHHTVIDDDLESYTVERLLKMKADHEQRVTLMTNEQAAHATQLFIGQSVTSINQSGGLTARTVNITVHPPLADETEVARRIRRFRDERLERIMAGQPEWPLHHGACMVLHVVPVSSFAEEQSAIDVVQPAIERGRLLLPPLGSNYGWNRLPFQLATNLDGVVAYTGQPQTSCYSQLFRSGAIEGVDLLGLDHNNMPYLAGTVFENTLVAGLRSYFLLLDSVGIKPPVYAFIAFCGMRGCHLRYSYGGPDYYQAGPLSESKILLPEVVMEQFTDDFPAALKRPFDVIWNAFGFPRSDKFNGQGRWIGTG